MTIFWVILIFGLLVFVHELGHFVAARRSGIEAEEFGFGFPPRLIGKKIGKTLYSINLLPLGGFVRLKGEDGEPGPHSFAAARIGTKTKVLLAGVAMNLLAAYLILVWLCFSGLPPVVPGQFSLGNPQPAGQPKVVVAQVTAGSPADKAGIKKGDVLIAGNSQEFSDERQVYDFSRQQAGRKVGLTVQSGRRVHTVTVQLRQPQAGSGFLGVVPLKLALVRYGWLSPVVAAGLTLQLAAGTLVAFAGLIAGLIRHAQVSGQVAGPVGIVQLLGLLLPLGVNFALVFVASISVSLAVINVLPLPALDGGRLAILWVQKISRRRLSPRAEGFIHAAGFVLLVLLMAVVTFFDVKRLGQ